MVEAQLPLHVCHVKKTDMVINRIHIFIHGIALLAMFYYRIATLSQIIRTRETPLIPYLLVFLSEVVLSFLWILHRPSKWRPVTRVAYPERLPEDEKLPPVDVFVCTVDPSKEPSLGVMNTVISAMAMDYPSDKIAVYLSDDGGAPLTLAAMKETWKFAKVWIPFCRKYEVKIRCPDAYFSTPDESSGEQFLADRKIIQEKYEEFKETLERNLETIGTSVSRDHPPIVKIINDATDDGSLESNQKGIPLLVYVAREKRPTHPHHFKAGAINVLLRVSAMISNAPYFVVLDCDHYCNDPTAARQAMCFYFDPEISPKLAWVQFPQHFHNISQHDLYDGNIYYYWRMGGLGWAKRTNYYRLQLFHEKGGIYGMDDIPKEANLSLLRKYFGSSNELIKSTYENYKPNISRDVGKISDVLQKEIDLLASCSYDHGTEWGLQVGAGYNSVVEDSFTSLKLHSKGWISVWVDPAKPCFLGTCPTNMNDMLVQQTRWALGLLLIGVSKDCPLTKWSTKMPILQTMSYGGLTLDPLYVIPFFGLGIVPQICLLHGVSLYPKVGDPFFFVFAFIFISSQLKHVQEVVSYGSPVRTALYDLRVWMMKSGACYLYAALNAILDQLGLQEANFSITSKVVDEEETKRHQEGTYDFQSSPQLLAPMCSLYLINLVAFLVGAVRIFEGDKGREMFAQTVIPWFGVIVNYHLLDGMVMRKDKARVSPAVTMLSVAISASILFFGSLLVFF